MKEGDYAEAEALLTEGYRELLDHANRRPPWDEDLLADVRGSLVALYQATGRPEEVGRLEDDRIEELRARLDRALKSPGGALIERLRAAEALGNALADSERKDEVAPIFEEAVAWVREAGWPLEPEYVAVYERLRLAVSRVGHHDRAAELAAGVVERLRARPGTPREVLNEEVFALASHRLWGRRREEAEPLLREAVAMQAEIDAESWGMTKRNFFLGTDLLGLKKYDEAEAILKECHEQAVERIDGAPRWETHFPGAIAGRLAELYAATGRAEEAERWRAKRGGD
jgi:tetratricopeptide (TPR) repeat protein